MIPVRLVRVDVHNIAVEKLVDTEITEVSVSAEGKRLRRKTGKTRREWVETAYYGNVAMAAKNAVFEALPMNFPITPEMIAQAVETICQNTKEALA